MKSMSFKVAMAISLLFFTGVNSSSEIDKSQTVLVGKIGDYLIQEEYQLVEDYYAPGGEKKGGTGQQLEDEIKNRQDVVDMFFIGGLSEGICFGLVYTWLYCERMSDEPRTDPSKERDDMDFFKKVTGWLLNWDEKKPFAKKEKSEIERFINYVMVFQYIENWLPTLHQDESLNFLSDTHGRTIQLFKKYTVSRGPKTFETEINKILNDNPNVLLSIAFYATKKITSSSGSIKSERAGHIIGIYHSTKKDTSEKGSEEKKYYGFDPNESSGIRAFSTVEGLAQWAWGRIDPGWIDKGATGSLRQNLREITFRLGTLSATPEKVLPYSIDNILQDFDTALENSSLIIANPHDQRIKNLYINESMLLIFYKSLNAGVLTEDDKAKINKIIEYVLTAGFSYSDAFKQLLITENPKIVTQLVVNYVNTIKKTCTDIEDFLPAMQPKKLIAVPLRNIQKLLFEFINKGEPVDLAKVRELQDASKKFLEELSKIPSSDKELLLDKELLEDEYENILLTIDDLIKAIKTPLSSSKTIDSCLSGLKLHYEVIVHLVSGLFHRIDAVQDHILSLLKSDNTLTEDTVKKSCQEVTEIISYLTSFLSWQSDGLSRNDFKGKDLDDCFRQVNGKIILDDYKIVLSQLENIAQFVAFGSIILPKQKPPVAPKPKPLPVIPEELVIKKTVIPVTEKLIGSSKQKPLIAPKPVLKKLLVPAIESPVKPSVAPKPVIRKKSISVN